MIKYTTLVCPGAKTSVYRLQLRLQPKVSAPAGSGSGSATLSGTLVKMYLTNLGVDVGEKTPTWMDYDPTLHSGFTWSGLYPHAASPSPLYTSYKKQVYKYTVD